MERIGSRLVQNSIDRQPDEVLISIVSLLPVMEAGRTSILAHRWSYFWMFHSVLNFDGSRVLCTFEKVGKPIKSGRVTFMKEVNRVLNLHSSTTIEEFRIVFNFDKRYARVIDRWIKFAFANGVRRLELNLARSYTGGLHHGRYIFPNLCHHMEHLYVLPVGSCESLATLRLAEVDVTGEVLEFFLCSCPFLGRIMCQRFKPPEKFKNQLSINSVEASGLVNCLGFRDIDIYVLWA